MRLHVDEMLIVINGSHMNEQAHILIFSPMQFGLRSYILNGARSFGAFVVDQLLGYLVIDFLLSEGE